MNCGLQVQVTMSKRSDQTRPKRSEILPVRIKEWKRMEPGCADDLLEELQHPRVVLSQRFWLHQRYGLNLTLHSNLFMIPTHRAVPILLFTCYVNGFWSQYRSTLLGTLRISLQPYITPCQHQFDSLLTASRRVSTVFLTESQNFLVKSFEIRYFTMSSKRTISFFLRPKGFVIP